MGSLLNDLTHKALYEGPIYRGYTMPAYTSNKQILNAIQETLTIKGLMLLAVELSDMRIEGSLSHGMARVYNDMLDAKIAILRQPNTPLIDTYTMYAHGVDFDKYTPNIEQCLDYVGYTGDARKGAKLMLNNLNSITVCSSVDGSMVTITKR